MEKLIVLSGSETKKELREKLNIANIVYGEKDTRDALIMKVTIYNDGIEWKQEKEKREKRKREEESKKKVNGETFCDMKGLGNRSKFFVNKKYKREEKSLVQWEIVLKEDGLL